MTERDPFGRLPDENPLEGLGSLSEGTNGHTPEPVAAAWGAEAGISQPVEEGGASKAEARKAAAETLKRLRASGTSPEAARAAAQKMLEVTDAMNPERIVVTVRRIFRIVQAVVIVAVIIIVISIIATIAVSGGDDAESPSKLESGSGDPADVRPSPLAEVPAQPKVPESAPVPVGLGRHSLLVRGNLAPALRRLRTDGLGRLQNLRIAPERVDAQLLTSGGRLRSVQLRYDGELRRLSLSGAGFGHLQTIPFAQVDPAAPARLARSAAGRLQRPVSQVDYVVRLNGGAGAAWTVVMRNGGQFVGDARGRITRRIG